ncbi:MAG: NAD(P)/FAD-dependent oxidoreductase [Planctomycetota bacterium]|nr:NAD(P)/FAD-dependent oxidoreductase [Planctomycetota bacterium]MDA0934341.1 NAD(P)/FAD-dependent oxidoreductase [Planctomycetota bacterium]MDA1220537.1 NAD(P)/FAD-dependent oxidoreductase [Planctomycetota bacterium]
MTQPHVVILGGGFAGLAAARELRGAPVRITLVDRRNHHLFQPLLYQVATAALNPSDIAYPIRSVLRRQENVRTLLAKAQSIDVERKAVVLADGELAYDFLIVATGATHSYFGRDDWAAWAPGLKSIEDALEIRNRVLSAYEAAEAEPDPARVRELLTFVVVGGGPTGVELAGALIEIGRQTVARDFRSFDPRSLRVVLIEGSPRLLPPFDPKLSAEAERELQKLGVEVITGVHVTRIDSDGVGYGAEEIRARTVLWAAGVAASPLGRTLGATTDRAGRVQVLPDLTVPGHPEVLVAGDLISLQFDGRPVPGVAPAAVQAGRHAAKNVRRALSGERLQAFRYRDKGSLATVGRAAAVAQFGRFRIAGLVAWWLWWVVHIFYLIGYRNRLAVMIGWAWQYFAFSRGARLITGRAWSPTASRDVPSDPGADPAVSGAPPGTADAG